MSQVIFFTNDTIQLVDGLDELEAHRQASKMRRDGVDAIAFKGHAQWAVVYEEDCHCGTNRTVCPGPDKDGETAEDFLAIVEDAIVDGHMDGRCYKCNDWLKHKAYILSL